MSFAEPLQFVPPPLKRARARRIPSGVEVATDQRKVRIRLPKNCNALQFLECIFRHSRLSLEVRMEAAALALPFTVPRLLAVVQQPAHSAPSPTTLRILGGMSRLPGTNTRIPFPSDVELEVPATPDEVEQNNQMVDISSTSAR
jgi:hypothetical protein